MEEGLNGQVALFTGPLTPLTLTVARWLGNAGVRLALAGPRIGADPGLQPLLYQFRRDTFCFDVDLSDPQTVHDIAEQTERVLGGLDMLIHTLGGAQAERCVDLLDPGARAVVWNGSPPLRAALTCSNGAMRFMARRQHGHVLHLVTRADVGALEVERLVLKRLQQSWQQHGVPRNVTMSAVYFEEVAALLPPASASNRPEPRLLEMFTERLVEEEGWIRKVMLEREIGSLIQNICRGLDGVSPGRIQSFDFSRDSDTSRTRTLKPI
jgi:hypothetical protein